jgi:DNA-binding beta-propeller fold protein YncE
MSRRVLQIVWMALGMTALLRSVPGRGAEPPLVLERAIALPNVSGRIDHMAIDPRRGRLLVAELGNGTVDVIDLASDRIVHRFEGLHEPQGIGYAPAPDVIAIASAGDGSVRLFRAADFEPMTTIALGNDADNIRLDPLSGHLVVGYGDGGLAVIDPVSGSVLGRVKLAAHPESFQIDPDGRRVFVNVPDAQQIAVVDLGAERQLSAWQVPGLRSNFPMARDQAGQIIATVFRSPPRLVLLDARSGAVQANIQTCGDADDVFLDPKRDRIYVSCGDGRVDVLVKNAAAYRQAGMVKTSPGARTSLFVPAMDRLFVAARAGFFGLGSDAAILVLRPQN